MLQCVAVCCSMLQYVAVCCSVLQCDIHVCTFFVYLIGVNTRMSVYETHICTLLVCVLHMCTLRCVSPMYVFAHITSVLEIQVYTRGWVCVIHIWSDYGCVTVRYQPHVPVWANGRREPPVLHGHWRSCPVVSHRGPLLSLAASRPVFVSSPFRIQDNCWRRVRWNMVLLARDGAPSGRMWKTADLICQYTQIHGGEGGGEQERKGVSSNLIEFIARKKELHNCIVLSNVCCSVLYCVAVCCSVYVAPSPGGASKISTLNYFPNTHANTHFFNISGQRKFVIIFCCKKFKRALVESHKKIWKIRFL